MHARFGTAPRPGSAAPSGVQPLKAWPPGNAANTPTLRAGSRQHATQNAASASASNRVGRPVRSSSSTAATVQVPPRCKARPIVAAQSRAASRA